MSREINFKLKRGCTLKSGEIFSVNEVIPVNITADQLQAGIENGTYTLRSLNNKIFKGQVRERANSAVIADIVFNTVNNKMTFTVPASVTKTWPNKNDTFFYDVFETDTSTGEVREVVYGKIVLVQAITKEAEV